MITRDDLIKMQDPTDYSWIKVKRFLEPESVPFPEDYVRLVEHHRKETEFLVAKCRELAHLVSPRELL